MVQIDQKRLTQAKNLADNELLGEFFDRLKNECVEEWIEAKGDTNLQIHIHHRVTAVLLIRDIINDYARDIIETAARESKAESAAIKPARFYKDE
jgi:hypothetical protein